MKDNSMKKLLAMFATLFIVTSSNAMQYTCGFHCPTPLEDGSPICIVSDDKGEVYIGHEECVRGYNSKKDTAKVITLYRIRQGTQTPKHLSGHIGTILKRERQKQKQKEQQEPAKDDDARIQRAVAKAHAEMESSKYDLSSLGDSESAMHLYARCFQP